MTNSNLFPLVAVAALFLTVAVPADATETPATGVGQRNYTGPRPELTKKVGIASVRVQEDGTVIIRSVRGVWSYHDKNCDELKGKYLAFESTSDEGKQIYSAIWAAFLQGKDVILRVRRGDCIDIPVWTFDAWETKSVSMVQHVEVFQ